MGNSHGGRRIKINFNSNDKGEVCFQIIEMAYPHSTRSKRFSGCGEWLLWEQKYPHRPAQAFLELFFALRDLRLVGNTIGVVAAKEYWLRDMDYSRDKRLAEVKQNIPIIKT